jgi:hypothetical protein
LGWEAVIPRNGTGIYFLPQPPFVAGTVISSAAVNSDLSDIAAALTGSFARDGQSSMSGQFKAVDGALAAPGLSFNNETNTGFTRPGVGQLGVVIQGVQIATFSSVGIVSTTPTATPLDNSTKIASTAYVDAAIVAIPPIVPATTVMLFWQAAAPTGWTKLVTQNDKALRVVSGTGGVAGGTNAFSTVMAQTVVGSSTLSTAQLAVHAHSIANQGSGTAGPGGCISVAVATAGGGTSGNAGSGTSHNHTITMGIQFIDIILCSKD